MNNKIKKFLIESNAIEDVYDLDSYIQARKAWDFLSTKSRLTCQYILKVHEILMKGKLKPSETGALRTCGVWIAGRPGKPWHTLPKLLHKWVNRANDFGNERNDHVEFEKIHPFVDGNGRVGRILLNWQRIQKEKPVLVIESKHRDRYYKWFNGNTGYPEEEEHQARSIRYEDFVSMNNYSVWSGGMITIPSGAGAIVQPRIEIRAFESNTNNGQAERNEEEETPV